MAATPVKIIEWAPEYSVHVEEIDREHQKWFDMLNRLHAAMLEGRGQEQLRVLMADMTWYALEHIAHEEALMASTHYPDYRTHVRQHEALRSRSQEFAERVERGETTVTIEVTVFLTAWIKQHILTSDLRLAEHLQKRRGANRNP